MRAREPRCRSFGVLLAILPAVFRGTNDMLAQLNSLDHRRGQAYKRGFEVPAPEEMSPVQIRVADASESGSNINFTLMSGQGRFYFAQLIGC